MKRKLILSQIKKKKKISFILFIYKNTLIQNFFLVLNSFNIKLLK